MEEWDSADTGLYVVVRLLCGARSFFLAHFVNANGV